MLRKVLELANQQFPQAKRIFPCRVKRWLIWNFVGGRADYQNKSKLPSRKVLEREILPWLASTERSVFFIGAGAYTYPYYQKFEQARVRFATIDINPSTSVWGAREHILGSVLDAQNLPSGQFDTVICNGVFGFGIDGEANMNRAVEVFAKLLRPRGVLILGWNKGCIADPADLRAINDFFVPDATLPFLSRLEFKEETHVYDLRRLRADRT